jgi:hypothetical protein
MALFNKNEMTLQMQAYFMNEGQGMQILQKINKIQGDLAKFCTVVYTAETRFKSVLIKTKAHAQPFQEKFVPNGEKKMIPNEWDLHHCVVYDELNPLAFEGTYLQFLTEHKLFVEDMKLFPYYMNEHFLPALAESFVLYDLFHGIWQAPVDNVPTVAGHVIDGFRKKIEKYTLAGKIAPKALGAIPLTNEVNLVKYFEDFVDTNPIEYQNPDLLTPVFVSPLVYNKFFDANKKVYNSAYSQIPDPAVIQTSLRRSKTGISVQPCNEMIGADDFAFQTLKGNMMLAYSSNPNNMEFKFLENTRENIWGFDMAGKFYCGVDFGIVDPKTIYVN